MKLAKQFAAFVAGWLILWMVIFFSASAINEVWK